jgi:hypothetical protein
MPRIHLCVASVLVDAVDVSAGQHELAHTSDEAAITSHGRARISLGTRGVLVTLLGRRSRRDCLVFSGVNVDLIVEHVDRARERSKDEYSAR